GQWPARGPVAKTFTHDIKSLFWVLVWVVAPRPQFENRRGVDDKAKAAIQSLTRSEYEAAARLREEFPSRQRLPWDI
ncbi:hypothetical protein FRC12_015014, partial [Ceratobasidium sp. 428]